MVDVGKMIATLRKERHLTQIELADKLGLSKQAISHYELGRREPDYVTLEAIADILNVPMAMLITKEDQQKALAQIYSAYEKTAYKDKTMLFEGQDASVIHTKHIPIIGDTAAGAPIIANREYDEFVDVPIDGRRFDAAVRVKGDSMEPGYRIGDLALIHYQEDVEDGQIAVVCLDDEVTLKRVYHTPTGVILQSDNHKYPAMIITAEEVSNIHLTGRAIGVLHWED